MKFSRKTDYAIILVDALKQSYFSGRMECIGDIATSNHISRLFLEKVAQGLRDRDIVESRKGKGGGYRLARHPGLLTLWDVISTCEKTEITARMKSLTADRRCPAAQFCAPKRRWADIEGKIQKIFQETTFV